jgi:hypothetical protein
MGVFKQKPAFPAMSRPASSPRPTPVKIVGPVKAKTGGPGNDATSSVAGDSAPVNPTSMGGGKGKIDPFLHGFPPRRK